MIEKERRRYAIKVHAMKGGKKKRTNGLISDPHIGEPLPIPRRRVQNRVSSTILGVIERVVTYLFRCGHGLIEVERVQLGGERNNTGADIRRDEIG